MPRIAKLFPCSELDQRLMGPSVLRLVATPFARATKDPLYPSKLQYLVATPAMFAIPAVREYLARALSDPDMLYQGMFRYIDWDQVTSVQSPLHLADLTYRIARCPKPVIMPIVLARWFKSWFEHPGHSDPEFEDLYRYISRMKAFSQPDQST